MPVRRLIEKGDLGLTAQLKTLLKPIVKSASIPVGTGGAYGGEVKIEPDSGYDRIIPLGVRIVVGGTFATGETVTVKVQFNLEDDTANILELDFTATGEYVLSESDLEKLFKDAVGILSLSFQAKSSATSTSVTVDVYVRGLEYY